MYIKIFALIFFKNEKFYYCKWYHRMIFSHMANYFRNENFIIYKAQKKEIKYK